MTNRWAASLARAKVIEAVSHSHSLCRAISSDKFPGHVLFCTLLKTYSGIYIQASDVMVFNEFSLLLSGHPCDRRSRYNHKITMRTDRRVRQRRQSRGAGYKIHTAVKYDSATTRALAFRLSFISLISLSTSSMNLQL